MNAPAKIDAAAPPPAGHNEPPLLERLQLTHADLAEKCADILRRADALPATIGNDDDLMKVAEYVKELNGATKRAEALRVDEKEPFLTAERTVDGFFGKLSKPLTTIKARLETMAGAYQRAKEAAERRKREEEARLAREVAERERKEAERLAAEKNRQHEAEAAADRANEAAIEARVATKAADAKPAELVRTRSASGAMATAKASWDFEITDSRALDLDALRPHIPRAAIEQALRSFIAAGGREIEGARIFETTKAVFR